MTSPTDQTAVDPREPDLYLIDCCFGDSGTPGVDCDCVWDSGDEDEEPR